MKKETFDITGMTCSACANRIEKTVQKVSGLQDVSVNLLKNSMVASYDESVANTQTIIEAVEKAGYGAVSHTNDASGQSKETSGESKSVEQEQI